MTLKPDPTTAGYDNTIDGVPVNVVQGGSSGGSGGTVQVADGTTPAQLLAVDASGRITAVLSSQAFTNTVLTNVADATATHWLGTKDQALAGCISNNVVAVAGAVTNAILTAVEDQTTHYLATKDVTLNTLVGVGSTLPVSGSVTATLSSQAFTNAVLTAVEDQQAHYLATGNSVTTGTLQNAATGTGTGTAFTVTGQKMVALQVTSTVVGTITYDFEVSVDGTNFMTGVDVTDAQGVDWVGSISQTGTGTWVYQFMCAGITKIQCNITANAATGGTSVTVTGQATA